MTSRTAQLTLLGLIYLLLSLHVLAEIFYLYWIFPWFDMLTHFLGGTWIGLAALWLVYVSGYMRPRTWSVKQGLVYVLIAVFSIGGAWELYEISIHLVVAIPFEHGYFFDTCKDLVMDTLGGITSYLYFWYADKKKLA